VKSLPGRAGEVDGCLAGQPGQGHGYVSGTGQSKRCPGATDPEGLIRGHRILQHLHVLGGGRLPVYRGGGRAVHGLAQRPRRVEVGGCRGRDRLHPVLAKPGP